MAILTSKHNFEGATFNAGFYINSKLFKKHTNDIYYYFHGEVVSHDIEELIDVVLFERYNKLELVLGEFFLIVINGVDGRVHFVNDRSGREILFYSTKNDFSISDSFWSLVSHEKYTAKDIDPITLKTQLFFSSTPDHTSILKGLNILENASVGMYSKTGLVIKKYWNFALKANKNSLNDKYDQLDCVLDTSFKDIANNNPIGTKYGLGISGGLDSRIIPYYAKKHGMPISGFIIGEERPNKILISNDHNSSRAVANYFGLQLDSLPFNDLSYAKKNEIDAYNFPLGSSQIFKIPDVNKCNFDVLLTGASGFIVGSSPFYDAIRQLDIVDMVLTQQSDLKIKPPFYRFKKGLNYVFGTGLNIKSRHVDQKDGLLSNADIQCICENYASYFKNMQSLTKTEKLMNYAIGVLGQRNKLGAFESLVGLKKSYTPYTSSMIDAVETWSEDEIYNRTIFENFIRNRLPFLANIRAQDHKVSLSNNSPNILQKLISVSEYVTRGNGVMNYNNWATRPDFVSFTNAEFEEKDFISEYVNLKNIKRLTFNGSLDSAVLTAAIKFNKVIALISSQGQE